MKTPCAMHSKARKANRSTGKDRNLSNAGSGEGMQKQESKLQKCNEEKKYLVVMIYDYSAAKMNLDQMVQEQELSGGHVLCLSRDLFRISKTTSGKEVLKKPVEGKENNCVR